MTLYYKPGPRNQEPQKPIFMPKIPHDLLLELKAALRQTHDDPAGFMAFIGMMDGAQLQLGYNDVNAPTEIFEHGKWNFIKALNVKGTLPYFIQTYYQQYPDNDAVKGLFKRFQDLFETDPHGAFQLRKKLFDHVVVQKRNKLFINRRETKYFFYQMFHGKRPQVLVIHGKPRSGLSYLKNYFSHLSNESKVFSFRKIDLREDLERNEDELVYPVHIAKHLAIELKMKDRYQELDTGLGKDFKFQSFLTNLKVHLEEQGQINLFFFDHFDDTVADEVYDFITGLANIFTINNAPGFMLLAGYKETGMEQLDTMNIPYEENILSSFEEDGFRQFLTKLHKSIVNEDPRFEDWLDPVNTFVDTGMRLYTDQDLNVEKVGERTQLWYKKIRQLLDRKIIESEF